MDRTDWINRSCGCTVSAGIHPPDPFHLVAGFQRFRNALGIRHLFYYPKKKRLRLPVNIREIGVQFAAGQVVVSDQFIFQPGAFIRDKFFHSYNLLFLSAIIAAGGIAEIECTDSKKRRLGITSKTALFCCGSERTLYGEAAAEEIGVRPIPVWQITLTLIEFQGGAVVFGNVPPLWKNFS